MKTVLVVPGFRENVKSKDYDLLVKAIESRGYEVKRVPINWQRTLLTDWVKELKKIYDSCDPANTILAGFSYGAMTVFMTAIERNPSELWLFSLSPYFSDDMPNMKEAWIKNIGHRRADQFSKLEFNKLAPKITCKTLIFLGEIEAKKYPLLDKRAITAHKLITNSQLVRINNVGHDISDQKYVEAIRANI